MNPWCLCVSLEALRSCRVFWWSASASMVTGRRSRLWRQSVKALGLPAGRGRGEPYVILYSVAEAAGSGGVGETGRKSNSRCGVQRGYSGITTSGGATGQPIGGPVYPSSRYPVTHAVLWFVLWDVISLDFAVCSGNGGKNLLLNKDAPCGCGCPKCFLIWHSHQCMRPSYPPTGLFV